ncbi:DUF4433 domain-containing protein [Candidatus Bathyarchaeota archaeon]|nr:DUF4433 domain-containing protein [Candidatus Bathyarchaeota archaeon]
MPGLWEQERNQLALQFRKSLVKTYCQLYQISALYYITDWKNLESIFEHGLLCYNLVKTQKIPHLTFADENIQSRRSKVFVGGGYAHDYVPLFFFPKPPMLYRLQREYQKKSHQHEIIYICISNEVLCEESVHFTDKSLATSTPTVFEKIEDLAMLRWDIIRDFIIKGPTDWKDSEKINIKGAEVFILERIDRRWFQKIVVYDQNIKNFLSAKFPNLHIPIEVNQEYYF